MAQDPTRTHLRADMRVQVPRPWGLAVGTLIDPRRASHVPYWLVRFEDPDDGMVTLAFSEEDIVVMPV